VLRFTLLSLAVSALIACGGDDTSMTRDSGPPPDANPCALPDGDGDGYDRAVCGGDDCDDADPLVHPGGYDGPWAGPRLDEWTGLMELDAVLDMTTAADDTVHLIAVHSGVAFHVTAGDMGVSSDVIIGGGITDGAIVVAGDTVHIVVAGAPGSLSYQRRVGGGDFEPEAVGEAGYAGMRVALAVGIDGEPRVVYDNAGELLYGVRSAGTWTVESIAADFCDMETGCGLGYGILSDGEEHIVYVDDAGDAQHGVLPMRRWRFSSIGPVGAGASAAMVIGPDDAPHAVIAGDEVSYFAALSGELSTIDAGPATSSDIAVAADGTIHVAFAAAGALHHSSAPAMGAFVPAERITADYAGAATALVLGSTEEPVVAAGLRYDADRGALWLMRRTGANGVDEDCDGADWSE